MNVLPPYRTIVQRAAAALVDAIIFIPLLLMGILLVDSDNRYSVLYWDLFFIGAWVAYSVFMHSRYGQTLGKMSASVKLFCRDESSLPSAGRCLARELVGILVMLLDAAEDFFGLTHDLNVLWYASTGLMLAQCTAVLLHPKRMGIHDLVAGTVVIDVARYRKWDFEFERTQKEE